MEFEAMEAEYNESKKLSAFQQMKLQVSET